MNGEVSGEGKGRKGNDPNKDRREFIKTCSRWVAGHFVLLNGAVFSSPGSAEAQTSQCAKKRADGSYTTDASCRTSNQGGKVQFDKDCGRPASMGAGPVFTGDGDCGSPYNSKGGDKKLTQDYDCGLAMEPSGARYEDNNCGLTTEPGKSGKSSWYSDSDCEPVSLTSEFMQDNDCEVSSSATDSSTCGLPAGGGFFYADDDCAKGVPVKTDMVCGSPIEGQPPYPGDVTADLDCGIELGRSSPWEHADAACGLSAYTGGSNMDYDCGGLSNAGFTNEDNDCGKPKKAGLGHWGDYDCGKLNSSTSSWQDNTCDLAWWKDVF